MSQTNQRHSSAAASQLATLITSELVGPCVLPVFACVTGRTDTVLAGTRHVYLLLIITSINNRDRHKIRWLQLLRSTELGLAGPFICARNMSGLYSLSPANPRCTINPLKPSGHYMYRTVVTICTASLTFTTLRSAHTVYLCVLCGSQNKQPLFPYTTLTDCFL